MAYEATIANAGRFCDAITLETPERLRQAACESVVFGHVTLDQKRELARALRSPSAALTSFVSIADLVRFAAVFDISHADVAMSSTFLLLVVDLLILIAFVTPANR